MFPGVRGFLGALDVCYSLGTRAAAQDSVYAPTFSSHLVKLACDVSVLSSCLATAVISVTVCEFELVDALCAMRVDCVCVCVCLSFINPI